MGRQGLVVAVSLLIFLAFFPSNVGAPVKGVNTTPIQSVSAQAPGQGMGVATHLSQYSHSQDLYQESYKNSLKNSENVEQVINERLNRLEGVSEEVGDAYANTLAREVLQNGMSDLTEAAVSETVEAASVETDQETIRVAVLQTSITDARGEVHLEFKGDRIFVATESEGGSKSYRGSVDAANGQFGDLDPETFKGSTPIEALRTACDQITAEEWESAKEQFAPVINEEFGVRERIIELASKDVVCNTLENGGGNFDVPG